MHFASIHKNNRHHHRQLPLWVFTTCSVDFLSLLQLHNCICNFVDDGAGKIFTVSIFVIIFTILIRCIMCISWVYCICKWVSDAENASDAGDARAKASPPSKSILPPTQSSSSSSSSSYSPPMPTKISLSTSPKYHCVLWATPSLVFLCLADNIGCHVSRVEVGGEK